MRWRTGGRVYVKSCGLREFDAVDPFAVAVLDEIGIDISSHTPMTYEALADDSFDLIMTLSPDAHHRSLEITRTNAVDIEYWPTYDPTAVGGSRETRLSAYREVRDQLDARIKSRFAEFATP